MQTTFETKLEEFIQGQVTPHGVKEQITLMATEDVNFGLPVKRTTGGEGDRGALITGESDTIAGIVRHEHNDKGLMVSGKALGVLTKGNIAVPTEGTGIIAGDKAYFVVATQKFTKVVGTNIEVGVFQTAVKNDTLAVVKIDIVA